MSTVSIVSGARSSCRPSRSVLSRRQCSLFLVPALSGALLLTNPSTAQAQNTGTSAGHWEAVPLNGDADINGRYPGTLHIGPDSYPATQAYQGQRGGQFFQGSASGFASYAECNNSYALNANFSPHTSFRWVPDTPGTPPPAYLQIKKKLSAEAWWATRDPNNSGGATSVSVSGPGLASSTPDPHMKPIYEMSSDGTHIGQRIVRTLLLHIPSGGQTVVEVPGGSISAQAQISGGYSSVKVGADFQEDNRSVKLGRNLKDRSEIGADGNWVTYGDTIFGYTLDYGDHHNHVEQTILASPFPGGGWSHHVGEEQGSHYDYYGDTHEWNYGGPATVKNELINSTLLGIPDGQLDKTTGTWRGTVSSPQVETINYKITDDDGAEANAKYILTIHDPVELLREVVSVAQVDVPLYKPNGEAVTTGTGGASKGNTSVSSDVSVSQGWSVGGTFDVSSWVPMLSITGSIEGSSTEQVGTSAYLDFNVPPNQIAQAFVTHFYDRHHLFFWCYDEDGLIPRYATHGSMDPTGSSTDPHSIDPYPAADGESRIVPDEAWYDVFNRSSTPMWKGPFYNTVVPNQSQAPVLQPPAPSNTYS